MTCGVYAIRHINSGKMYVGSSKNIESRWLYAHLATLLKGQHFNHKLQNAWNKYGQDQFVHEILEVVDASYLQEREQYFINELKAIENGYNIVKDVLRPSLGRIVSAETRAKLSRAGKGHFVSQETRQKLRKAHTGKRLSSVTKERLREANLGHKVSKQTRQKMSESSGWIRTDKHIQALQAGRDAYHQDVKNGKRPKPKQRTAIKCKLSHAIQGTIEADSIWELASKAPISKSSIDRLRSGICDQIRGWSLSIASGS